MNRLMRELDPRLEAPILVDVSDFSVNFTIPVSNSGNIHALPVGRIELYDEDGTLLRKIGKESIKSPEGVFLGEKTVDYLPVNDEGGNVLPGSNRIYSVTWKGFAYDAIEDGKSVVKFLSPGAYYTRLSEDNARYLLPWEKLKIFIASKKVHAKIYVEYSGLNAVPVPYNLERDIYVKYNYIDKGINYGALLLILLVVIIAWRIIRKKDDEIEYLEEEVDEFEKAKKMAKKALEKKTLKNVPKARSNPKETESTVARKTVPKTSPKKPEVKTTSAKKVPVKKTIQPTSKE